MRNPNVKILLIALALIVIVAAAGLFVMPHFSLPQQSANPETPLTDESHTQPEIDAEIHAYLRVQAGDSVWEPIPLVDGGEYTMKQSDELVNVIHTTATGAVMHSSTCDNQSCVEQGWVTLENRESRVLGNLIICLPNEVVLEVLTPEEAGMEAK